MIKTLCLAACSFVVGCSFGGGDGDPTDGYRPMDAGPSELDATVSDASSNPLDAVVRADAAPQDSGGPTPVDASMQSCTPIPVPAVCDPVKNTGCGPLSQCEPDPEATMPAGRCVFWNLQLGDTCSSNALNTTCDYSQACVEGKCRRTCYCDADCETGTCRDSAPGPSGPIKLCTP